MESVENIPEYHDFISRSMTALIECLANNKVKEAKQLLKFNIEYAYTLVETKEENMDNSPAKVAVDILRTIRKMELDEKEIDELVVLMTTYQSLAGLKPTQHLKLGADKFAKVRKKLY